MVSARSKVMRDVRVRESKSTNVWGILLFSEIGRVLLNQRASRTLRHNNAAAPGLAYSPSLRASPFYYLLFFISSFCLLPACLPACLPVRLPAFSLYFFLCRLPLVWLFFSVTFHFIVRFFKFLTWSTQLYSYRSFKVLSHESSRFRLFPSQLRAHRFEWYCSLKNF